MPPLFDFSHPVTWIAWFAVAAGVYYLLSDAYKLRKIQSNTELSSAEAAHTRAKRDIVHADNDTAVEDQREINKYKGLKFVDVEAEKELLALKTELELRKLWEKIRADLHFGRQEAMDGLEAERIEVVQDHAIYDDKKRRLFVAVDEYETLKASPGPGGATKLKALRTQIRLLTGDLYGEKAGRAFVQEADREEPGRPAADAPEAGEHPGTDREAPQ